jgi:hypothetical protein
MTTAVLIVALLSGLCTLLFVLDGVRRVYTRSGGIGPRAMLVTAGLSALTAIFTIWQVVQVVRQFEFHW